MKAGNSLDWPVPPRSAALIDEFIRKLDTSGNPTAWVDEVGLRLPGQL